MFFGLPHIISSFSLLTTLDFSLHVYALRQYDPSKSRGTVEPPVIRQLHQTRPHRQHLLEPRLAIHSQPRHGHPHTAKCPPPAGPPAFGFAACDPPVATITPSETDDHVRNGIIDHARTTPPQ